MPGLSTRRKSDTTQDWSFLTFFQSILFGSKWFIASCFLNLIYTQNKGIKWWLNLSGKVTRCRIYLQDEKVTRSPTYLLWFLNWYYPANVSVGVGRNFEGPGLLLALSAGLLHDEGGDLVGGDRQMPVGRRANLAGEAGGVPNKRGHLQKSDTDHYTIENRYCPLYYRESFDTVHYTIEIF